MPVPNGTLLLHYAADGDVQLVRFSKQAVYTFDNSALHASGDRMTNVMIELSPKEIHTLKMRTGKRTVGAALKAWIASADAHRTNEQLRAALAQSVIEEAEGKGRRFKSGRDAVRWLES